MIALATSCTQRQLSLKSTQNPRLVPTPSGFALLFSMSFVSFVPRPSSLETSSWWSALPRTGLECLRAGPPRRGRVQRAPGLTAARPRSRPRVTGARQPTFLVCWSVLVIGLGLFIGACGRTPSRILGKKARQVLEVEGLSTDNFIDISFDRRGASTVKDVTFKAADGYVYTVEFRDVSPFEGTIRWVPHGQSSSVIQSRGLSRVFGTPVNLELPEDCVDILAVDVTYNSENERTKNLVYLSSQGRILAKEYREGLVDRFLGGWLEVRGTK